MNSKSRRLAFEDLESRRLLAAVNIPENLSGQVGAEVSTPVNIDNAAGIRAAEIRIQYDPAVLSLSAGDITAGTAWGNSPDTQVVANVDAESGTVIVFISSSSDLTAVAGSIVVFGFNILDSAIPGTESVIDLVDVRLNEGAINVTPAPMAGDDPTDGQILVLDDDPGQADRIAGTVFADANNDNQIGEFEGIPGVIITLVNVATNASVQTTTGDDGRFEFINVAAGNYRIVQTHPTAYRDGGNNEISATLAVGQNLANQNFREFGLRPAFVYNRLLTTTVMPVGSPNWIASLRSINIDAAAAVAESTHTEVAAATSQFLSLHSAAPTNSLSPSNAGAEGAESFAIDTAAIAHSFATLVSSADMADELGVPLAGAVSGGAPAPVDEDEQDVLHSVDSVFAQSSLW